MPETLDPVRKMAYYPPAVWARLRQRLFDENKSYAQWAREQAEAYTKPKKART
jgi:hypothetical protein